MTTSKPRARRTSSRRSAPTRPPLYALPDGVELNAPSESHDPPESDQPSERVVMGAADIVRSIPDLMGFIPSRSLVLVCLRGKLVGPISRVDLPTGQGRSGSTDDPLLRTLALTQLTDHLGQHASRHGDRVIVVVYSVRADGPDDLAQAISGLQSSGQDVAFGALVCDGWITIVDPETGLGQDAVRLDEEGPARLALMSAQAWAGHSVLESREELVASIALPTGVPAARGRSAVDAARAMLVDSERGLAPMRARSERAARALRAAERARGQIEERGAVELAVAAELALLVEDRDIRDQLLGHVVLSRHRPWVAVLVSSLVQLPGEHSEDLCSVLIAAAYRSGQGALAQIAIDRVRKTNPYHRLTELLAQLADAGMPPETLDDMGCHLLEVLSSDPR